MFTNNHVLDAGVPYPPRPAHRADRAAEPFRSAAAHLGGATWPEPASGSAVPAARGTWRRVPPTTGGAHRCASARKELLCVGNENWSAASPPWPDRKSTRLNSSHVSISYAVFCLKKKNI